MNPRTNYGAKQMHGLYFGLYHFVDDRMIIQDVEQGGSLRRVTNQAIEEIPKGVPLFQFGNIFGLKTSHLLHERTRFIHPQRLRDGGWEFYYWDNPTLPHVLYKGPWNPEGFKNWCRITHNSTMSEGDFTLGEGEQKLNHELETLTQGTHTTWQDIVGKRQPCQPRGSTVLLCPSSREMFLHYYNINASEWIKNKTKTLTKMGYKVEVRMKPGRQQREQGGGKLRDRLARNDIAFTVSCHSVGAIESILAGTPAVVEGWHSGGELATPWDEFRNSNSLRTPSQEAITQWVKRLLDDTHHKTSVYSGEWFRVQRNRECSQHIPS
jgi:hypothetical protein